MKRQLLLIILLLPIAGFSAATWVGPAAVTIANWNNAANWSPASVPAAAEQITFNTTVTIVENVPVAVSNPLRILNPGNVTIAATVTITIGNLEVNGVAGSLTINGTLVANNVTYGTTAGGAITNSGSFTAHNLNVGNGANAGSFTNNGAVAVTSDIVVEEGLFDNNSGASATTNGITIRSGGTVLSGGTLTSAGNTSNAQINVESGGVLNNETTGILNAQITAGNAYAISISGSFTNSGTTNIGVSPYNAGSQGALAASGASFISTGLLTFSIDPANCILTNNTGDGGSFSVARVTIYSGNNCLGTPLPVKYGAAALTCRGDSVLLYWRTLLEENLVKYNIEESSDAQLFYKVVEGTAKGIPSDYAITIAASGITKYYRIAFINRDGKAEYSNILVTHCSNINAGLMSLSLQPNLLRRGSSAAAVIKANGYRGVVTLYVTDNLGRLTSKQQLMVSADWVYTPLLVSKVRAGIYCINVITATGIQLPAKWMIIVD